MWLSSFANLYIVQKKDKYGFADETGKVIIKEQYQSVTPFADGRSKVQKNNKWGYIDTNGKAVINIEFDLIEAFNQEGIAKAKKNGKWGYIDSNGKPTIKLEYEVLESFNEKGLARVKKGGKWGYIRKDGSIYIKPEWNFIGTPNENGYLWVSKAKSLELGAIGLFKDDVLIVKPHYRYLGFYQTTDDIDFADGHVFSTGDANEIKANHDTLSVSDIPYIWFDQSYRRGILDLNGNVVVKPMPYAMGAPSDGMVTLRRYDSKKSTYSYNYISLSAPGNKIFKKDITLSTKLPEGCFPFSNGAALIVSNSDGAYLIDKTGERRSKSYASALSIGNNMFIVEANGLKGLINTSGKEMIPCKYASLQAPLGKNGKYLSAQDKVTEKCGIVDLSGETVVPFQYVKTGGVLNDKAYVKDDMGWSIIDMNLNPIIKSRWADLIAMQNPSDKIMWVKGELDGKWQTLDIASDAIVYDYAFDEVSAFDPDGHAVVKKDEKYGMVTDLGLTIIPTMFSKYLYVNYALKQMHEEGRETMRESDAYRYNIYLNPDRHKYKLHQVIDADMWDF